jgi:hypothetical protein
VGSLSEDIQSSFPSNKLKAFINIKYTANWLNSKESDFLDLMEFNHNNIIF